MPCYTNENIISFIKFQRFPRGGPLIKHDMFAWAAFIQQSLFYSSIARRDTQA